MERAVDLPIELRRLIYQRYLQARARHLWNAVRQFVKRLQIVHSWVDTTRYAELSLPEMPVLPLPPAFNRMRRLFTNLRRLKLPDESEVGLLHSVMRAPRRAYNIRPQRGVKRPLEDFL